MTMTPSDRAAALRSDPFSQLPPHVAVQYAYLRRTAALAETLADLIVLARDFVRTVTGAIVGRGTLPAPANSDAKVEPLAPSLTHPAATAANNDRSPRTA